MMRVRWVKIWIDPMAALTERFRKEDGSIDFESLGREEYEFRHALIVGDFAKSARAKEAADQAAKDFKYHSENGKKGGRPRKDAAGPMPSDRQAVIDFATAEGLDVDDACECFYATTERKNKTSNGEKITDWKNYVKTWCKTRAKRRSA